MNWYEALSSQGSDNVFNEKGVAFMSGVFEPLGINCLHAYWFLWSQLHYRSECLQDFFMGSGKGILPPEWY